jgi:carbon-monoxide dehydrogenase small subunit
VRRKAARPEIDARVEMSGNLCRCTGYVGIMRAVEAVAAEASPATTAAARPPWLGPAPGPGGSTALSPGAAAGAPVAASPAPAPEPHAAPRAARKPVAARFVKVDVGDITVVDGVTRLTQSFVLQHTVAAVWALMGDPEQVAPCLPGLVLDGPREDNRLVGHMEVGIGPIVARFSGTGTITQTGPHRMTVEARGTDRRSGSRVSGRIAYAVADAGTGADLSNNLDANSNANSGGAPGTRVDCTIEFNLQGPLAQFGRSDLVREIAGRIGESFAQNVDLRLRVPDAAIAPAARLGGLSLIVGGLWRTLQRRLARFFGRDE